MCRLGWLSARIQAFSQDQKHSNDLRSVSRMDLGQESKAEAIVDLFRLLLGHRRVSDFGEQRYRQVL